MSCETIDLKEYFFGEASPGDRRLVESHLEACACCREELSRLQLTQAALGALRDEELPRRIAFVSDKVFEPRWYQRLWNSGAQLGFIAASLLACAIFVHAFVRPVTPSPQSTVVATIDQAAIEREVAKRVDEAVIKAVAASEVRQQKKTVELLQAAEKRYEIDRRGIIQQVAGRFEFIQKAMNRDYAVNAGLESGR